MSEVSSTAKLNVPDEVQEEFNESLDADIKEWLLGLEKHMEELGTDPRQ